MQIPLVILSAILALARFCDAAKILVLFPFPGKSHSILGEGFVRALTQAGHEVTYVTPFLIKNPHPKVRQIDVTDNMKVNLVKMVNITNILNKVTDVKDISNFFPLLVEVNRKTLLNENMQRIMNDSKEEFDVIIIEWMFNEMGVGLSAVFNCPFIWFSSIEPHSHVLKLIDETLNPSYNPDPFLEGVPPYSFLERVKKLMSFATGTLLKEYLSIPMERQNYQELYEPILAKKGRVLPPFEDLRFNASIMLGNSHVALGQPTRLPQSYKPIGGYHIDSNVKPLPEDLKNIMDNAKNGVIYFSMGSNLRSTDLPDSIKKSLVKMFGELKYTVLWKFEDSFSDLPKNVHIIKWAPQPSILSHSNCKLFITHGGLLSTTEAVHFGVPVIGIPVFADQFMNVERAENKGYGKRVELSYDLAAELKVTIEEMVAVPKYFNKAKELSMIYHDRPVPPAAELVHWVEHVVRTRGAVHLRSPALHVPWYQKIYLDFILFVLAIMLIVVRIIKKICCSRKLVSSQKKRN